MIDINGRNPFSKLNYKEINQKLGDDFGSALGGRVQEITDFRWLDKEQGYAEVPLYPQRTVVQFNSTYMELIGRQDRIRGDVTAWGVFYVAIVSYIFYAIIIMLNMKPGEETSLYFIIFLLVCLVFISFLLAMLVALLSTELFSYTYLPMRFNRKTRKVYVRQANRKVETFDWDELMFYMATTYKAGGDVRGVTLADDGESFPNFV